MKKIFYLILFILFFQFNAFSLPSDKAQGLFIAIGVGPRIPVFNFSNTTIVGYGFNLELSYTDTDYLPFFLFGKVGFEQFPGSQDYYRVSEYSNFSTQMLPLEIGARYYLPPIMENIVLILPHIEFSASFLVYQHLHQFKAGVAKSNFVEDGTEFGFSIGVGASMFLVELLASYNYYNNLQNLSFDIKARLPINISF